MGNIIAICTLIGIISIFVIIGIGFHKQGNCPLREKKIVKFLFFKFKISMPHEYKINEIGVFMPFVSDDFVVNKKCKHCDKFVNEHFVSHEELIKLGYSKEDIKKARYNRI